MSHQTRQSLENDGYRALLSLDTRQMVLRSRRGTDMAPAFPEITAAVGQLPDQTALDGELGSVFKRILPRVGTTRD